MPHPLILLSCCAEVLGIVQYLFFPRPKIIDKSCSVLLGDGEIFVNAVQIKGLPREHNKLLRPTSNSYHKSNQHYAPD